MNIPVAELADYVVNFPFPFPKNRYRYSANVEPSGGIRETEAGQWGEQQYVVDRFYRADLAERDRILQREPSRCQTLDHMRSVAWDALLYTLKTLARDYPDQMELTVDEDTGQWLWVNRLLDIDQVFTYADEATLPCPPLEFLGRNVQEDVVLLDQRAGNLWADAGVVTFAADWSFGFDTGMSFLQIHGPVPRVHDEKIMTRAQDFIMRLQLGESYRRTNWTLSVDGHLDQATETYPEWGKGRTELVTGDLAEVGDRLFLRTEVQHLIRLPRSAAVMFLIRTYLISFRDVCLVPQWAARLCEVLEELPEDMAEYKGIDRIRGPGIEWLHRFGGVSHVDS